MLRWSVNVKWNLVKIQLAFKRLPASEVHDYFIEIKDSEQQLLSPAREEPSTPAVIHVSAIVPSRRCPEPAHSHTYADSSPPIIGLQEIHDLLRAHHSLFMDFKGAVDNRLTHIESSITELKAEFQDLHKAIQHPGGELPLKRVKASPLGSLIRMIKVREGRRKRQLSSPYVVFERKNKSKLAQTVAEETKDVTGVNKDEADQPYHSPFVREDAEGVNKNESTALYPTLNDDINVDQPTVDNKDNEEDQEQVEIYYVDENYPDKVCPASVVVDFPTREIIPDYMREAIDLCCSKFTDLSDLVINMGHVSLTRRYLDELLKEGWLGNEQLYKAVSDVKEFVEHITTKTVANVELILLPIINNQHWRLLVCVIRERRWRFYDSLPNRIHMNITGAIIKHFWDDVGPAFEFDMSSWPVHMARGKPVQSNSIDCGIYVCKYMEVIVQKKKPDWKEYME